MYRSFLLYFVLLFSLLGYTQAISVDPNRTPDDLVRNVLLNSPCVNPSNISVSTGTQYGSSNGFGYFSNTNPNFPLQEGVILSTGSVTNAVGPNTTRLQDGSNSWLGDTDLTNIFTTNPAFPAQFVNATSLEFDFTSFSPNFNFNFLFASEEYGTYQCNSYDGIAILLTHPNGTVENLAIVPGTSTPISVETIRDKLYNSSCESSHPQFFGSFNGGFNATTSPINFNGQTVVLTASKSGLIQGGLYHLKIVVADRNVTSDDSAIFIGGSSFDFGTDVLGADVTLCTNDGVNQNYTINSNLDPNYFSFEWKDSNGAIIGTNASVTVNQADTYTLSYFIKSTLCKVADNDIKISYNTVTNNAVPENLYQCQNALATSYTFELGYNTALLNPTNNYTISYHNSQSQAQQPTLPSLPLSYTVASGALPQTIWIRIQDANGCYITKSFTLFLTPSPSATKPSDITRCELAADGKTAQIFPIDFSTISSTVLNGQSPNIYNVSYHLLADFSDAPYNITTTSTLGTTTFYIKVSLKTDPNCTAITQFDFIVKPKPSLDIIADQYVCNDFKLPQPTNPNTQYWSGPDQTGTQWAVGFPITVNNTVVYQYLESGGTPNCPNERSFTVRIVTTNDVTPDDVSGCDSVALPPYKVPGTKYYSDAARTQEVKPGDLITTLGTTTIYITFTPTDPLCPQTHEDFFVTVSKTPTISTTFQNIFDCTQVSSLPSITTDIGTANYYTRDTATGNYIPLTFPVTTSTQVYAFAENNGCRSTIYDFVIYIGSIDLKNIEVCAPPYTLNAPPVGEYRTLPNGGGSLISNPITQNTTVYHYVANQSCTNNSPFNITFYQPQLENIQPASACESFTLPTTPYPTTISNLRYFTTSGGPNAAGDNEKFPGDQITSSTIIYVYKETENPPASFTTTCYKEIPWTITINTKPVIDERGDQIVCFKYDLTPLTNGNYYEDPNGQNPITDLTIDSSDLRAGTEQSTRIKTIYVYAVNPNDANCFNQSSFTITFDSVEAPTIDNVNACDSYELKALANPNMVYYDQPYDPLHPELPHPGNIIAPQTFNSTNVISPIYIYTETNNKLKCIDEKSFTITINNTPVLDASLPAAFNYCNSFTLPTLTIGKYYNKSISDTSGTRVELPITTYDSKNLPPASIFVYTENTTNTKCFIEREIPINLYNVTELTNPAPSCSSYQLKPTDLKLGENYYDSNGVLLANNATINTAGDHIIYIRGNAPFNPSCQDESSFTVKIVGQPIANTVLMPEQCDLDNDPFDGKFEFDLSLLDSSILGNQIPATDFKIEYFDSLTKANDLTATPLPKRYTNDTAFDDSIWARITNTTVGSCFSVSSEIKLKVNPLPKSSLKDEYFICEDYATGTLYNSAILDTGLPVQNYTYVWKHNGIDLNHSANTLTTNLVGDYTVLITNELTKCQKTYTTKVTKYAPYIEVEYSDAFENPTYIKVTVLGNGSGNYSYQLDGGNFQDSNIFNNVSSGEHIINVMDNNGHCSPAPIIVTIINYPKYFTPNGDGYHETWNIPDLVTTNPTTAIYIFDRYQKLLKQIFPNTPGWDGTFIGTPMPADDYWFTVEFEEKGVKKVFKSHFTLKR